MSNLTELHIAAEADSKQRITDYLVGVFNPINTKSSIKKAIKKEEITINGVIAKTSDFISGGERIEYRQETVKKPLLELKLEVLYEDDFLAIINKPAGMEVSGNKLRTIENALRFNLKPSQQNDAILNPEPIHRLDYPTSGALLIGKTHQSIRLLNQMFEAKSIKKVYYAITMGDINKEGELNTMVDSKDANTVYIKEYQVASQRFKALNLLRLQPSTGRKHQLRIHLSEIGNPILGDKQYGKEEFILKGKGLYLHAKSLHFRHPVSNDLINVEAPLPKKFLAIFPEASG